MLIKFKAFIVVNNEFIIIISLNVIDLSSLNINFNFLFYFHFHDIRVFSRLKLKVILF